MALRARSRTAPSPQRCTSERRAGDVLPAVFKDLNPLRQLQNAKRIRRLELGRSRREIWMYWHVLPGLALGTPRLYGYRWEPKRGNLWLFVEDAGPHRLAHRGDLGLFEQAAAWVGRFHAATTGMESDERLLRYERAHYERRCRDLEAADGDATGLLRRQAFTGPGQCRLETLQRGGRRRGHPPSSQLVGLLGG